MTTQSAHRARIPAITHRSVLALALPIILSNASEPLIGIVDTTIIGRMGEVAPIGAVGVGAQIFSMTFWIFGFLQMSASGLTANAVGAGDGREAARVLMRTVMLAVSIGLVLIATQAGIAALMFAAIDAPDAVEALARDYYDIRVWSAPFVLMNYAAVGWLTGQGRTGLVLAHQIFLNSVNIVLDVVFAVHLGWGVEGVAAGTLIAHICACAFAGWLALRPFREMSPQGLQLRDRALRARDTVGRMMALNRDFLIRTALLEFAFFWFMRESAGHGAVVLAANVVLMNFFMLSAFALDGFAIAAETLCGRAFGARNRVAFRQGASLTGAWAAGFGLILALIIAVAGHWLVDLMTTAPEVRLEARDKLWWAAATPAVGWLCFILDGIFIGAARGREMRNGMLIATPVYLAASFVLGAAYGPHGLWAALIVLFVVRGAAFLALYPAIERSVAPAG